ncbi:MAG: PaaI family thioesterase [Desulfobacterales bacterium]|nr:PaaI family thioesterase [Desulfobacterales bacterium]
METNSSGYTGPHQFERKKWISCAPFERLLQMNIVRVDEGQAVLTMPFSAELAQGAGLMHGGALVSLADTAVVMAIKSIVEPHTHFATISLESTFLYPVRKGIVTAHAEVKAAENRLISGRATLYNDDQKEILHFISTFKVAEKTIIKGAACTDIPDSN